MTPPEPKRSPTAPASAPPVLNYAYQIPRRPVRDAGFLIFGAVVFALIGLAVLGGTIDLLIVTWPSFGSTLFAVPAAVIGAAFLIVASTAARAAFAPTSTVINRD